jgi:hypothetical protein
MPDGAGPSGIGARRYSAQIQAAYMKYLRETGAELDIDQFVEIFGARVSDPSIRLRTRPKIRVYPFHDPTIQG